MKRSRKWAFTTTDLDAMTQMENEFAHVFIGPTEYGDNPAGHRHGMLLLKDINRKRPNAIGSQKAI